MKIWAYQFQSALLIAAVALSTSCNDPLSNLPQFADWPVNSFGYELQREPMPKSFYSSFAQGHTIYLGGRDGHIYTVDERDINGTFKDLGAPNGIHTPKFVYASTQGTVFTSPNLRDTYRYRDEATGWTRNQLSGWRMAEDPQGRLYFGPYKHDGDSGPAQVFISDDQGDEWTEVFRDEINKHIHTIRWDARTERIYISFGDDHRERGQAMSLDRGETFEILAQGSDQGHTDAAMSSDYIFWGSDDGSGRLYRFDAKHEKGEPLFAGDQFVWFVVAEGEQIYAGTVPPESASTPAALLASSDQGKTWQKLIEVDIDEPNYLVGVRGDSRFLSADGWLYFTAGRTSYRVRKLD